jgi:hypothetical protein
MLTLILMALICAYFTPSIVALLRSHRDVLAILALNLFAGWTFVGWVATLVWSLSGNVLADDAVLGDGQF